MYKPRRPVAAVLVTLAAAGCGGGDDSKPKPISGAPKQVADTVAALERATADRDFERVCTELFTSRVVEQMGGARECPRVLRRSAAGVEEPRIQVRSIRVRGDQAAVVVTTTARGQAPANDTLQLVKEDGRFKIASLGP